MKFSFNHQEWKEILTELYKRAAVDHQFHVLCVRDCHAAIKLISGHQLPKQFTIRFEPQQQDEIVLVLPKENKELFHELSHHDLSEIAEGMARVCVALSHTRETHPHP